MTLNSPLQYIGRLWTRLTQPAPGLKTREDREVAHLLSSVELALVVAAILILPLWILSDPDFHTLNWIVPILSITLIAAYLVGRGERYRLGAYILIGALYFVIVSVLVTAPGSMHERMLVLNFLITAMLLGSVLLPVRLLLLSFAGSVVSVALFFAVPGAPTVDTFSALVSVTVTSTLILLITQLRRRDLNRLIESERPYYALFEQSHDGIFLLDLNGVHTKVNSRAAEMLGFRPDELIGMSFRETVHPSELDDSKNVLARLQAGERIPIYERTLRKKDGAPLPVEISVALVRNNAGQPLHIQSVVRDLTERKRHEAALRESEAYQRAIITNAPFGCHFYYLAEDGRLVLEGGNPAADDILGIQHESLLGKDITEAFPSLDPGGVPAIYRRIAAQRDTKWQGEVEYPASGEMRNFEVHAFPSIGNSIAVFFTDITVRKQAALALQQSEERFSSAFRNSPVPMIIVAAQATLTTATGPQRQVERTFIDANEAFLNLVGYSWEELAGKGAVEMGIAIPSEARSRRLTLLDTQRRYPPSEVQIRTRSGELRDVLISAQRITVGSQLCDIEILLDTTELTRAQKALRESEAQLKSIMESMQEIVWSASFVPGSGSKMPLFQIRYMNPHTEQIFGRPPAAFYANNRLWFDTVYQEDREIAADAGRDLLAHGSAEVDYRIVRPDGSTRWLHSRTWLVRDASGKPIRADGLATDITERRLAQEQAFALAVEKERVRVLIQFVQSASHELRTPLSTIAASAYLLTRLNEPERRQVYADQIQMQIARLSRLIDKLLVMTELDNATPFVLTPLDFNSLVRRCVEGVQQLAEQSEVALDFTPAANLPRLTADWDWLEQAIDSIVNNAVRYTPEGGAVHVQTRQRGERLVLEISDTGPGISENDLPHIFERFWRADEAHTTPGFGLGLPIAQEVIRRHGGAIEIDTAPGQGSTFRVALPVMPQPAMPVAALS